MITPLEAARGREKRLLDECAELQRKILENDIQLQRAQVTVAYRGRTASTYSQDLMMLNEQLANAVIERHAVEERLIAQRLPAPVLKTLQDAAVALTAH